jgi:N-acetylglucosamine kinase-like BadF-type ATPase
VVTQAAHQGDRVALDLLDQAGQALAEMALAVMARLNMLEAGMNVFATGGVFQAGAFVNNPFRETLQARSKASTIDEAAFSPIVGALFLALQAAGSMLDERVIAAIRDTLPQTAISKHREKENG